VKEDKFLNISWVKRCSFSRNSHPSYTKQTLWRSWRSNNL